MNVNALNPGIVGGARRDRLCGEKPKRRGWTAEQSVTVGGWDV